MSAGDALPATRRARPRRSFPCRTGQIESIFLREPLLPPDLRIPIPHAAAQQQQAAAAMAAAAAAGWHLLGALALRRLSPPAHSWTPAAAAAAAAARRCRRLHAASAAAAADGDEAPAKPHVVGQPRLEPDWTMAAAMAGASFEAYGGLQERGLAEQHSGGAHVHYVDRAFLRTTMPAGGLLHINLHSAACLPAADLAPWTSDPYTLLCVGDSCYRSATVLNNLNPSWGETFSLFVRDRTAQALTVRVMDEDFGAPDDYLGSAVQSLESIADGQTHELELPLRGSPFVDDEGGGCSDGGDDSGPSSGGGGTVRLACRFIPFSELLAEGAPEPTVDGQRLLASPGQVRSLHGRLVSHGCQLRCCLTLTAPNPPRFPRHPQIPLAADWQQLLSLAGVVPDAMLTQVAFVENEGTNTQARGGHDTGQA